MTGKLTRPVLIAAALCMMARPGPAQDKRPQATTLTGETSYGCLVCHADKRRAFVQGIHSEWGIRCHDCHGGNPESLEIEPAHAGVFIGVPDKLKGNAIHAFCDP